MEIWLVDSDDMLLFRKLKDGREQVLPIDSKEDMDKFLCIDKREYEDLFKSIIDKGK